MPAGRAYSVRHDRLLRSYRRLALYGAWAAALNFVALLLTLLNMTGTAGSEGFGYGALFNCVGLAITGLSSAYTLATWYYYLLLVLFSVPLTAALVVLAPKAYRGSKAGLYWSAGLYGIDTLLCGLAVVVYRGQPLDMSLTVIAHVVIFGALILAIWRRKELIDLRKEHFSVPSDAIKPEKTTVMSFKKPGRRRSDLKTAGEKLEEKKVFTDSEDSSD